jgi:hypothetical protein
MSAFDAAVQVLTHIADTEKPTAVAEQSNATDQLLANIVHYLQNVRQAKMIWEREFSEDH